jgi:DNA-binding LytR/AlgR family response regulator
MEQARTSFVQKIGRRTRTVELSDVVAFEANHKYVDAFLRDGTAIVLDQDRDTIKGLALEFLEFKQINRGILVRRSAVLEFKRDISTGRYNVFMDNYVFPVSRRFVPSVREAWKNESEIRSREGLCGSVSPYVC